MSAQNFRELSRLAAPALEPVSLLQAKRQLRLEHDLDDADVLEYIRSAREWVEGHCWRAMYSQQWKVTFDGFPKTIRIPVPPLVTVDSVRFLADGAWATLDPTLYRVSTSDSRARLLPNDAWPWTDWGEGTVEVTYTCGYTRGVPNEDRAAGSPEVDDPAADGDPLGKIPKAMKQAVLLLVSHFYENRTPVVAQPGTVTVLELPFGVEALLAHHRAVDDL